MTSPALDLLNHMGPLKHSKSNDFDDNPVYTATAFDVDRFKRHLVTLLDRIGRLSGRSNDENLADDANGAYEEATAMDVEMSEWVNEVMAATIGN